MQGRDKERERRTSILTGVVDVDINHLKIFHQKVDVFVHRKKRLFNKQD